ncbi:MAG: S8 family serine peptidase [Lentisphaeria bacterium]|nr:S8 family serine peptidase [Lentisphaeria bacterium]
MPDFLKILQTDLKELQYSSKLRKVKIAVLDTGIDAAHPFVKGRVKESWRFDKNPDGTFVPVKVRRGCSNAIGGHGTEIASRILMCAPNVEIIDIRVLDLDYAGGGGLSELVLEGFKLAIASGAKVINMSYTARKSIERRIAPLCEEAYRNHLIVVAAKRNNPLEDDLGFPAELSSVIAVDKADMGSIFDILYTGVPPIEFAANGENVEVAQVSTSGYRNVCLSRRATGTSYATATVSAVIALFLGLYPDLKFFELKTLLKYLSDSRNTVNKYLHQRK